MPIQQTRTIAMVECASCPDCEKILVLGMLPAESKRPFVEGRARGWVIICGGCGNEFPVRSAEIFQTVKEDRPMQRRGAA